VAAAELNHRAHHFRHGRNGADGASTATDRPEPERRSEAAARLGRLTPRERDVAIAIARGLSNAEIAEAHFVSVTTVKTHVGRILDKLAVGNRVQIAICVHSALN
jgi:DNA-binding NarL/FixJ family response regulator